MNNVLSAMLGVCGEGNKGVLSETEKPFSLALEETEQFSQLVRTILLKKKGSN